MRNIFSPPVLASKTSWPLPAISLPPQLLSRLNEPNQFNHEARGGRAPEVYSAKILAAFRLCVSAPRQMCEVGARRGGGEEEEKNLSVPSLGALEQPWKMETSKLRKLGIRSWSFIFRREEQSVCEQHPVEGLNTGATFWRIEARG